MQSESYRVEVPVPIGAVELPGSVPVAFLLVLFPVSVPVPVPSGRVVPSVVCVGFVVVVFFAFPFDDFEVLVVVGSCWEVVPFCSLVVETELGLEVFGSVTCCVFLSVCADAVAKENSKTANKNRFFIAFDFIC